LKPQNIQNKRDSGDRVLQNPHSMWVTGKIIKHKGIGGVAARRFRLVWKVTSVLIPFSIYYHYKGCTITHLPSILGYIRLVLWEIDVLGGLTTKERDFVRTPSWSCAVATCAPSALGGLGGVLP
jgi:hypothetical protein